MIIACTPFVSLYFPLLGLLIVGWGLVAIAAYPKFTKMRWHILFLTPIIATGFSLGLVGVVFLCAALVVVCIIDIRDGRPFFLSIFGSYILMTILSQMLPITSSSFSFKSIFAVFQLSFLALGLLLLYTYIRRTGINPVTRSGSLKFQSAALLVLGFIVLLVKYSTFYGGDLGLYFHVFTAKIKIYLLMAGLLFLAAAIFAREESRYRKANAS